MISTYDLIKIIGSPYSEITPNVSSGQLESIYDRAFSDRVALLYLSIHREKNWSLVLENKFQILNTRMKNTLNVVSSLGETLNEFNENKYAIFKSLKPYPATPNDTDTIIFGNKDFFKSVIDYLYDRNYRFHEWAPMQTTLIHPDGIGKTGKGKKGGTYYIDVYSDISTDYFLYVDKNSVLPHVDTIVLNGKQIKIVRTEIELAIILFHNVFPERTFTLEHFYMPLYQLKNENFDLQIFLDFVENQKLSRGISTNFTLIEYIHNKLFGFVPVKVLYILDRFGRNYYELKRFIDSGESTLYLFSQKTFWLAFIDKLHDKSATKSLLNQGFHMLNPSFFLDVMVSLKNRLSDRGVYHLE